MSDSTGSRQESPQEQAAAQSGAAGYYVWPLVWLGSAPDNVHVSFGPGETPPPIALSQLEETVATADLSHGVRARAHRDGLIVFDFSAWAPYSEDGLADDRFESLANLVLRRVGLMNSHVACLLTALLRTQNLGLTVSALSPSLIFPMNSFDRPTSVGLPDSRMAHIYDARHPSTYGPYRPMVMDSRIGGRQLVELSTLERSFVLLDEILSGENPDRTIALVDLLVRGAAAHSAHDYNQSLITAWAVIESLLQERWEAYIQDNREREVDGVKLSFINAERKKRLTEDRDITASLTAEFLSIVDRLPMAGYRDVAQVRVARNKWMHDLTPSSGSTSRLAIETAASLLRLVGHADLDLPTGLSIQI